MVPPPLAPSRRNATTRRRRPGSKADCPRARRRRGAATAPLCVAARTTAATTSSRPLGPHLTDPQDSTSSTPLASKTPADSRAPRARHASEGKCGSRRAGCLARALPLPDLPRSEISLGPHALRGVWVHLRGVMPPRGSQCDEGKPRGPTVGKMARAGHPSAHPGSFRHLDRDRTAAADRPRQPRDRTQLQVRISLHIWHENVS